MTIGTGPIGQPGTRPVTVPGHRLVVWDSRGNHTIEDTRVFADAKQAYLDTIRADVYDALVETDWRVARASEDLLLGESPRIPQALVTARRDARDEGDRFEAVIEAATDLDGLDAAWNSGYPAFQVRLDKVSEETGKLGGGSRKGA